MYFIDAICLNLLTARRHEMGRECDKKDSVL